MPEQVNRNTMGTRFYNFQPPTPTLSSQTPHPQNSELLFIISPFDHLTILFIWLVSSNNTVE